MAGWQRWVLGWDASSSTTGTISQSQSAQSGAVVAREKFSVAVAKAQAPQAGSVVSRERFLITSAKAQATQTAALATRERFLAASTGLQPTQTGSVGSAERFVATGAHGQAPQTGAIAGDEIIVGGGGGGSGEAPQDGSIAVIGVDYVYDVAELVTHQDDAVWYDREGAAVQSAQTGSLLATHGERVAAIAAIQPAQSGAVAVQTDADEPLPDLVTAGVRRLHPQPQQPALVAVATAQRSQFGSLRASTNDDDLVLELAA